MEYTKKNTTHDIVASSPRANEIAEAICFFRALTSEEQRIAYAVLEGMKLQKNITKQKPKAIH